MGVRLESLMDSCDDVDGRSYIPELRGVRESLSSDVNEDTRLCDVQSTSGGGSCLVTPFVSTV